MEFLADANISQWKNKKIYKSQIYNFDLNKYNEDHLLVKINITKNSKIELIENNINININNKNIMG